MISYAQNAEDVVLNRAFADQPHGFYVDVGAAHPNVHSVTRHFYDRGWQGINIEPRPEVHAKLVARRPRDINLQVGVAEREARCVLYQVLAELTADVYCEEPDCGELSTFDALVARRQANSGRRVVETSVDVLTLNSVLERHAPEVIDFLKIDVEGVEDRVLAGLDLTSFRPRVLVIEAIDTCTHQMNADIWEARVTGSGYRRTLFDGLNLFFVREEESSGFAARLSYAACALDGYLTYRHVAALRRTQDLERNDIRRLVANIRNWLRNRRETRRIKRQRAA